MKLLIFFAFFLVNGEGTSYEGYKVYEVVPQSPQEAEHLHSLRSKFDFWEESKQLGKPNDIMVAPEDQDAFENDMAQYNFTFAVVVDNVERLIQRERIERSSTVRAADALGTVTFNSYMFHDEQMAYLRKLAEDYPNIVTTRKIGESYEGRDILVAEISSGSSGQVIQKPTIFVDAGIHCREWAAPTVALYIIQQLVENTTNAAMIQNVDWVILPNLNPDGYAFTQQENRLWRKNRRLAPGASCYGTDLNRNFGHYWMHDGASDNPCADTFAGPSAFSEPESQVLRDYLLAHNDTIKLYLTYHSYGEMMLFPWGYDTSISDDWQELQTLGEQAAAAIDSASELNSNYGASVGTSAQVLYAAAGGSDDWAKGVAGIQLSYCIELPDGDAPYWFMLPARQILPMVRETFEGVRVFHSYIENKFWTSLVNPALQFMRDSV